MLKNAINSIRRAAVLLILLVGPIACGDGGGAADPAADLTGTWKFILQPHPEEEADPNAVPTEVDAVQLRQDGNSLEGEYYTFIFHGDIDGSDVSLHGFHGDSDGNEDETVNMDLTIAGPDLLEGEGVSFAGDAKHDGGQERFIVRAERVAATADRVAKRKINVDAQAVCSAIGSLDSFLISQLTDNSFRPMGGCWLQKNGGGYYVFGETGPGSAVPIYTQTMYQPIEWAGCSVRTYSFTMRSRDTVWSIDKLLEVLRAGEEFYAASGFTSQAQVIELVTDFYQSFGDFAVSAAFNTNTQNISLYVNVKSSVSGDAVRNHPLIQTIYNALDLLGDVWFFAGTDNADTFQLRRSPAPAGPCNSPLYIFYLFGNIDVYYD